MRRAVRHHLVADAVEHLQVRLLGRLDLDKAHRWPGGSLSDGGGIDDVALVRFDVGLHELCRDDPHRVPECLDLAGEPL